MPGADVTVNATFALQDYTISLGEGYVNPMGQMSDRPFRGVNIVIDGYRTYKVVK